MLQPLVGIIMGSSSDFAIMNEAAQILEKLEIPFEINIVSAHRTPQKMMEYAANAHLRGMLRPVCESSDPNRATRNPASRWHFQAMSADRLPACRQSNTGILSCLAD